MLHVIWLILKIIGIVLLILLCLFLLLLLTVLLVPIRYRVKAEHGENLLAVEGGVSWFLHLVNVRFTHLEGVLHVRVRILRFIIFDNLKPKKARKPNKQKSSKMKKPVDKTAKRIQSKRSDIATEQVEVVNKIENINKAEIAKKVEKVTEPKNIDHIEETKKTYAKPEEQRIKQSFFKKIIDKIKELKEMVFRFIDKIKIAYEKCKNFIVNLKEKIKNLFEKITDIKSKAEMIYNFIKEESNKEGFLVTYSGVRKLLKHILPTKLRSRIVFGTGDPCSTGQALGAMSILYSFYGDKLQIIADFENKKFEGNHNARGRIRLITILIILIKLIFDKRFKQLKENFQILKEAL